MNNTELSPKEKVDYMKIALAFIGIAVSDMTTDMILQSYELILQKGGQVSIEDMVKIEYNTKEKYQPRKEFISQPNTDTNE